MWYNVAAMKNEDTTPNVVVRREKAIQELELINEEFENEIASLYEKRYTLQQLADLFHLPTATAVKRIVDKKRKG